MPPVVKFGKGWENGAKSTNPKVKTITTTTYHPGGLDKAFADPDWGASTAKQALDNGADIVFGAGGNTGNGALREVAEKSGALCVGIDTDQWNTVPESHPCLITSAMKLIDKGYVDGPSGPVRALGLTRPGSDAARNLFTRQTPTTQSLFAQRSAERNSIDRSMELGLDYLAEAIDRCE